MNKTWIGNRIDFLTSVLRMSRAAAGEQARREYANAQRRGIDLDAR